MKISDTRRAAIGLTLIVAFALGSPIAASAATPNVETPVVAPVEADYAPANVWTVLRDNFYSFETCESYRLDYAVNYPYHLASYCTEEAQSNGRHWLWMYYAT